MIIVDWWFSTGSDFASPAVPHPGDTTDIIDVMTGGLVGATDIDCVEVRDAAKHLSLNREAPHRKELSSSKCQHC